MVTTAILSGMPQPLSPVDNPTFANLTLSDGDGISQLQIGSAGFVKYTNSTNVLEATAGDEFKVTLTNGGFRVYDTAAAIGNGDSVNILAGFSGNTITSAGQSAILSGGSAANINHIDAGAYLSVIVGGYDHGIFADALASFIGGGGHNDIESGSHAVICGGSEHTIGGNTFGHYAGIFSGTTHTNTANYSVICGGFTNAINGSGTVTNCFIGGGDGQVINGNRGFIGGGRDHLVAGEYAGIGFGQDNETTGDWATCCGGFLNIVSSLCFVGGGASNITGTAVYAAIAGGHLNEASGNYSFAAGRRAKATAQGAFALHDSTNADYTVSASDKFGASFSGGFELIGNTSITGTLAISSLTTITSTAQTSTVTTITHNSTTTGIGLSVTSSSAAMTSGRLFSSTYTASSATLAVRSSVLNFFSASRTNTATSGTLTEDYDHVRISRVNVQDGAGGTFAPSGAVLRVELTSTQTAGTLNDATNVVEIAMATGGGSGNGLDITVPAGTPTLNTGKGIFIDCNANVKAVDIDGEQTTANCVDFQCDVLTTGNIIRAYSNSADTSARALLDITNDNVAATGTIPFRIRNDSTGPTAELGAIDGCVLRLARRDTTVQADDLIGRINFYNDDATLTTQNLFATIIVTATQDITSDAAAAKLVIQTTGTTVGGSPVDALEIGNDQNMKFGRASGAAGSRAVGRGEHTSAPAGTLATGEWEISVYDNATAPVFRVRYNDGGSVKTGDLALI